MLAGILLLALFAFCEKAGASQSDKPYFTDIGQFNYAKFLLNERDYRLAAREFARLIENFPASPLIPETQFRLAESYLYAGLYREAETEFRLFLSNFEDDPLAFEAGLKLKTASEGLRRSLLPSIPAPQIHQTRPGLRAVQVMLFEGRDYEELEGELARLKKSGIDTVIARVFHNSGDRFHPFAGHGDTRGVYFRSAAAPVVDDILCGLTQAAHRNGLKVFAWMTTRYADYGVEDDPELACKGYDIGAGAAARCKGLDLFNEKAVERLEAIYSELADYDIDGVLFQDDLVLRHNEGFGPYAAALFRKEEGADIDPEGLYITTPGEKKVHYTELFWKWASWKNRRLLDVAGRLKAAVVKKRPGARFALNLMYESVTNPPYALAWLSQDLEASTRAGFDYYSIMAYHRQMEEELDKDPGSIRLMIDGMVRQASKAVGEPHRLLIKLQTIDWKTGKPLSNGEVVSLIRGIKGIGGVSLAVVPYRSDFPFHELSDTGGLVLSAVPVAQEQGKRGTL